MNRFIPFLCIGLILGASGVAHGQYATSDSETCDEAWLSHQWASAAVHCQRSGTIGMLNAETNKLSAVGGGDSADANAAFVDGEIAAARNAARSAVAYHKLKNHDHAMDSVNIALTATKMGLDGSPTDEQRFTLYRLSNFLKNGAVFRASAPSSSLLN